MPDCEYKSVIGNTLSREKLKNFGIRIFLILRFAVMAVDFYLFVQHNLRIDALPPITRGGKGWHSLICVLAIWHLIDIGEIIAIVYPTPESFSNVKDVQSYIKTNTIFAFLRVVFHVILLCFGTTNCIEVAVAIGYKIGDCVVILPFRSDCMKQVAEWEEQKKLEDEQIKREAAIVEERPVDLAFPGVEIIGEDGKRIENVRLVGNRGNIENVIKENKQCLRNSSERTVRKPKQQDTAIQLENVD